MGQKILGIILGLIVGVAALGFTCFLGIAALSMTVEQPNEIELKSLLVVALLVALGSGIFIVHRVATRIA